MTAAHKKAKYVFIKARIIKIIFNIRFVYKIAISIDLRLRFERGVELTHAVGSYRSFPCVAPKLSPETNELIERRAAQAHVNRSEYVERTILAAENH
jgi:hypothetical protein